MQSRGEGGGSNDALRLARFGTKAARRDVMMSIARPLAPTSQLVASNSHSDCATPAQKT
jgi:hypothetical protein